MRVEYNKENTRIYDSYLIENKDLKEKIIDIMDERKFLNYPVTRTIESYTHETKAHNRLYKLHLFRSHTKDTDLEENIIWWKELIFYILGI